MGRAKEAICIAQAVLRDRPSSAEAYKLLGLCQLQCAGWVDAEASFRASIRLDRAEAESAAALSDLLLRDGRTAEAERTLRTALGHSRRSARLIARLAQLLTATGRAGEAILLTARPALSAAPDHDVLAQLADAQKAAGRLEKAAETYRRAAQLFPESAVAHHNVAAALGDLGQFEAAARSAARALAAGGNAAETWLVYARALFGSGRLDEAEQAFGQTIRRRPAYIEAHRELAQLIWMRTEDPRAATASVDAHILQFPQMHELFGIRASVLHHAGDTPNAYATLLQAIRRHPDEAGLHLSASHLAAMMEGGAGHAIEHAKRAMILLPGNDDAATALVAACLAAGEATAASSAAGLLLSRRPLDQRALAYQATAWRMLGDERYGALYDYAAFVRAWRMDVPEGWPTLEAYLADLAVALEGLHPFRTHPLEQSVRHGSQATHLLASDNRVIMAFFQAIDGPIRRHLADMGQGADPLRSRNNGRYRYQGAWSVRLRPGGFHTDHIHPEGWLSSACYIDLPPAQEGSRAAWIKFGQPGVPTAPTLPAEHFVEPSPGKLVLFPSYMWHGTVPFTTEGRRLSIAFDLLPA